MTLIPTLHCRDDTERRHRVRALPLNGFDYLEVSDDQRHLTVFFLGKAPDWITAKHLRIDGGLRVRDIRIVEVKVKRSEDPERDDCLIVTVDRPGDFSNYILCVIALDEEGRPTDDVPPDFDPRYACLCFSFKAGCPSDLDCNIAPVCPEQTRVEPAIDYLAKDYASFRRLILDRLALVMPEWQERHVPDLGIMLVELLAYVGDHLSYHQDAAATEAYLDTARQRISVRRHVRLIDYLLHEGCNARTWVTLGVSQDLPSLKLADFYVVTSAEQMAGRMVKEDALLAATTVPRLVFEPLLPIASNVTEIDLSKSHNEIRFYTWNGAQCCLPKGSTSATLIDPGVVPDTTSSDDEECGEDTSTLKPSDQTKERPRPENYLLHLKPYDVLIFEEMKGPHTGNPADADPA
ncbi:MAG: putative baseplate assembly protein, partial [Geminicoccaceae bacterium]